MVIGGASALVLLVAKHLTNLAKDAPQTTPRPSSNALDQAYFGDDSDPRTYVQSLDAERAPMQDEQHISR